MESKKMLFATVADGLKTIKEEYITGEVTEGEFADYLANNFDESFSDAIDPLIAFLAIQEFRQWDYEMEDEPQVTFGGTEVLAEENGLYGFFHNNKYIPLPQGVRIGIQKLNGVIELDDLVLAFGVTGTPELESLKPHFEAFIGEWSISSNRTGENREDGTVYYYQDGLYWYEFQNRKDAFRYLFNGERDMPHALCEYDDELSEQNGEESFTDWEYHNGFPAFDTNN